jgi:PAS domain S-box-containing protein
LEKPIEGKAQSQNIWISALRVTAEVARQATASETDVIRAVTEELKRIQLRGGVSLMTDDGQLQVQSQSLGQKLEKSLEVLTGTKISNYRFNPHEVDVYHQALSSGEAQFTEDRAAIVSQMIPPPARPILSGIMRILGNSNVIVAPLILGQIVIGTINVSATWLTPNDIPMVTALADHIAIALGHVRARAELEHSLQLQQLRSQVVVSASSALDLPVVLERIVHTAVTEIGADAGGVGLIDEHRKQLHFPYTIGTPEHYVKQASILDRNIATLLESRQPVMINDYQHSQQPTESGLESGLQAVLAAPMMIEDTSIGFLVVYSFTRNAVFTHRHMEMIQSIASIASTVVQNANLYSRAKRRAEESQALIHTARAISSSLDADTVLQEIAEQANDLLQADGSRIHLIDQETNMLKCVVAVEPDAEAIIAFPIPVGEGLTGLVVETGKPLLINDPVSDDRGIQVPGTPEDEPECLAIVPLSIRQHTMGAMGVRRLGYDRPFNQNDLELLMALAAQAAVSIENAHLYGQIEAQAHQLEKQVVERTRDLALSESRYRSLVESAQFGIFQVNPEGQLVYANQALADMAELPLDTVIGKTFSELMVIPPDLLAGVLQRFEDRISGRSDPLEVYEITIRTASGKELPTLVGVSIFTDEKDNPIGVTGVITDISERIELEHALRAERDRLDTLLKNIGDAVMVTDTDGRILFVNPAWERLHGYQADEILGKDPGFLQGPSYDTKEHNRMMGALKARQAWQGEATMQRSDGSSYEAAITMTPILGPSDRETTFVTVLHDISALKEVDRLKSQFVSDVSHELRTPLTNIRLYLDLLERVQDKTRVTRYLETLSRESDRLANLIDDLLSLSRLDVGATPLQPRPVDINRLLTSLAADRNSLANQQGLTLEIETDPDIPRIYGDGRLLGQIFTNLLTNAMNYTNDGGRITIRSHQAEHEGVPGVIVEVEDTGLGIMLDEQVDIFKRFFRGFASRSTGAPGTGLGLAICQEIAQRHGGFISVRSEGIPGKGSCFSVWLPSNQETHT